MYFSFGLKKIKILLVVSLLFLILINFFVFGKLIKTEDTPSAPFDCEAFIKEYTSQIDNKNKSWDLLGDRNSIFNYCEYFIEDNNEYLPVTFIEQDNQTYFMNLMTLNLVSKELEKLFKLYKEKKYNKELDDFKSLNTLEKVRVLELLKVTQIKQQEVLKPFSEIYFKLFGGNNNNVFIFILSINFLILILTIYLFIYIIRNIFTNFDKKFSFLIILNVFFLPFNLIYYLNFYKEPFILLSLIIIIFNFMYLFNKDKKIEKLAYSTFIIFLALKVISLIKFQYYLIYLMVFFLSSFILILKSNNFRDKIILILQAFLILILTSSYCLKNIGLFDNISKLSKDKLSFFSLTDKKDSKDRFYFNLKNKSVTTNPSNIIPFKTELFSNEYKLKKLKDYNHLVCDEPFFKLCKKINTLVHTIYYTKYATINENLNNPNLVNSELFRSPKELMFSLPISIIKGFIMPVKFSDNLLIILISIFKLSLFLLFIYFSILLLRKKKYHVLKKIFYIILLIMPLSLSIELVASNYFTYFRYVMPINILILIITAFSAIEIFFKNNVKYNR